MSRSLLALMLLGLVGAAQGCRICDSPYDYCGPVMPCSESCGAGGCGHSHGGYSQGGYAESGYSGGQSGCSTCGNGGGHSMSHSHEYEEGTVIQGRPTQGQPTPADSIPYQGSRPTTKSVMKSATKASYNAPTASTRSPYPAARSASKGNGPIFW